MANEENITDISAKEAVGTDSSKHILKHLENSEKRQQQKPDKIAETFKSGLTGLTETLVDIFKQRNRTPGSSNEEPPAKRIRPQTSTEIGLMSRVLCRKPMELTGLMLSGETDMLMPLMLIMMMMIFQMIVSASQIRAILILKMLKMLAARNSPDKIDLVGIISTESQAPTDPFLDQFSKDFTEDEKHGPNISPHLVVIVNNLWQQNISGDKFKDRLSKYPMPENCDKIFVPRYNEEIWNGESTLNSHLRDQDTILQKGYNANQQRNLSYY